MTFIPDGFPSLFSTFKMAVLLFAIFALPVLAGCQTAAVRPAGSGASDSLREVRVDASQVIGAIRSFQGVNCGPAPLVEGVPDVSAGYREVGIDIVRVHDFFGPGDMDAKWSHPDRIAVSVKASGARVVFPNWGADPEKEGSYNFGPTDRVIQAIVASGAEVYWRIGRSWSADPEPPADFDKFASIVKHVAMHYNQGWANGFHDKVRYWEFWNEPDLEANWFPGFAQPFWTGTPEQFYWLYEKTAVALKSLDSTMKVGACGKAAASWGGPYREGLMQYCVSRGVPLDFFSWHQYHDSSLAPYDMVRIGAEYRRLLDSFGLKGSEIHVSEWNRSLAMFGAGPVSQGSMEDAAFTGTALIYLQDSALSRSLHYRGDATPGGLFEANGRYRKKAYAFKATGSLLASPQRLVATGTDTLGFAVLAGKSRDGKTVQVLISNYEIPLDRRGSTRPGAAMLPRQNNIVYRNNRGYALTVTGLPWGQGEFTVKRYRLSGAEDFAMMEEPPGRGGAYTLERPLPPPGLELIVLKQK